MSIKRHYKLYKSGKQWCIAAITTAAIVAGLSVMTGIIRIIKKEN
jgi:hypothetical protein